MTSMKTSKALKYLPTFCLVAILLAGSARAQERRVEVSPFAGIQFGGGILSRPGRLEIESDLVYGVILDIRVRPDATIQALYGRQDTTLDFLSNDPFFPRHVRAGLAVETTIRRGGSLERAVTRTSPHRGRDAVDPKSKTGRMGPSVRLRVKTYLSPVRSRWKGVS
jgi:hypothetical protein